ncbi:MEDS domain-containing protein [Pseudonocardia sp. H11422]|uniref:MEDS domain-containing protein n=1 Tax=Pseudonocardia sp. H11422 TaxID=2835866 RepID=UPI0020298FC0|nr:MEDS domain-containing protein [Pseudonocardia sp. H11422]
MLLLENPVTDLDGVEVRDAFTTEVLIGGVPVTPHDHLCVFFRGREERDRLLLPYLRDGLRAGHACLCVTADGESSDLVRLVGEPDLDTGLLHATEAKDTYLSDGAFSPESMLERLDGWSTQLLVEQARPFVRAAGDMSWIEPLICPTFVADLLSTRHG